MATLVTIAEMLAQAIEDGVTVDDTDLQVIPFRWVNPTPPVIDIYPADPAQEDAAFGVQSSLFAWTVRARVASVDYEAAQRLLLDLMEPARPTGVRPALLADPTLDDTVEALDVARPSGHRFYDDSGRGEALLGVEWRVIVFNKTEPVS